jgi:hypothetical protein
MRQAQRRTLQDRQVRRFQLVRQVSVLQKSPSFASERPRGHPLRDRAGSPMKRWHSRMVAVC